jgi:hypothetical protein
MPAARSSTPPSRPGLVRKKFQARVGVYPQQPRIAVPFDLGLVATALSASRA